MHAGVLALQGDVIEHVRSVEHAGARAVEVRRPEHLDTVDALILPGGESTTLSLLMRLFGLDKAIRARVKKGMPLYGTCAGAILIAKHVDKKNGFFNFLDIDISRNAYGPQAESFQTKLQVKGLGRLPVHFIRAPSFTRIGKGVDTLATYKGKPVLVRKGNLLAGSFHTELSDNASLHRYFIEEVAR